MSTSIPKTISKYQIKGILGQGAMGIVYLGYDPQIERQVAIKTISSGNDSQHAFQDHADRFVQEAKLLAKCNHPNVVSILDFGHEHGMAYMVMEYIRGKSLKEMLKRTKGIPLMTVMSMFVQLLKALHVAHKNDIIHRDLKPENILLANKSTLKLTDFGIAKSDDNDMKTQIGVTVGTPKYMAPEQIYGTDELGAYTDIYSLFVILYEMMGLISDRHKYEWSPIQNYEGLAKHNKFDANIVVPVELQNFFSKGLSVSFLDRYETAADVVKDLKPLLNELKAQSNQSNNVEESDETSGFFTTGTVVTQTNEDLVIDDEHFTAMREHLSDLMGPMADFILTNALKSSHNQDQFIMQIAEKLDNQKVRESFIDRWRTY
ncbi:MAG: serine/threonine-protein kinase [Marinicella sp.]